MRLKLPKYVNGFQDRHDKTRYYFRRPGFPRTPLPGLPWTPAFMAAYEAAMSGEPQRPKSKAAAPRSFAALIDAYYQHKSFVELAPSTQATYRGILEAIRAHSGAVQVAVLTRQHVEAGLAKRHKTPSAANNWLKVMHRLMGIAIANDWRQDDPTAHVKPLRIKSEGFAFWPQELIEQYRAHHAVGTRARLALELLACTMQRRSDVIRMGRQHVRDGMLSITQQKTGTKVYIPVLPELRAAIDALPNAQMTFLVTGDGKPYTAPGFGNWFREQCDAAGVPAGYAAHGLRKAGAIRLAEHGCTVSEIAAWGGWKTLKEVERYTKGVSQARVARGVVAKLEAK